MAGPRVDSAADDHLGLGRTVGPEQQESGGYTYRH
jgi:hypothetical protein